MNSKPWYESKTVWVNIIAIALAVGYYLLDTPGIVPAAYVTYVAAGLGVLNIILRSIGTEPITLTRKKPDDANG